jgi:hypothetical protein
MIGASGAAALAEAGLGAGDEVVIEPVADGI